MCVPGIHRNTSRLMTGWFRGLALWHGSLGWSPRSRRWPGVRRARHPRRGIGAHVVNKSSSSLPVLRYRRPDGEEKDFVPLAGAFPHKMKVAVRTAEQDAHSVHLRLDRRGPGGILKSAWPGLMREFTAHSHRVLR